MADAQTQAELQLLHSLHIQHILGQGGGAPASTLSPLATPHMSPTPSPPINHSPASIPGSPIHHGHPSESVEGNITLAHHLQHLHLQQQQQISSEFVQGQNLFPRYIPNGCMPSLPPSPTCSSPVGIVGSGSCVGAISITSITQGLSGLSTNTGSITHGIPTVNVPLDLRIQQPSLSTSPHHSVHLHHRSPVITPLQLSPTNSTTLGMIQEENNIGFHQQLLGSDVVIENILSGKIRSQLSEKRINATGSKHLQTGINQSFPSHHPQISVTDEMGGEVTLVESLSSSDSSDSLTCDVNETSEIDGMIVEDFTLHQNSASFHNTLPSKVEFIPTSVIMEQTHEQMSQFQPTLNFVVQNNDLGVSRNRNVFASELLQKTSSGSFKVTLSDFCSRLTATDILGLVKRLIDARAPPKGFTFSSHMSDSGDYSEGGLALEYPGGVQIELMVCTDLGCELKGSLDISNTACLDNIHPEQTGFISERRKGIYHTPITSNKPDLEISTSQKKTEEMIQDIATTLKVVQDKTGKTPDRILYWHLKYEKEHADMEQTPKEVQQHVQSIQEEQTELQGDLTTMNAEQERFKGEQQAATSLVQKK
uniref:(California timema) hypothetical protein n=1 Tax=Timema californicum TaxID=61474 RepID=A0A7R9PBV9_TIMCA|nr:unnamed protein product [Timema californicum]